MKINLLAILSIFLISCEIANGQCNVVSNELDDGGLYYMHEKEKIYSNEDFEHGILVAYVQLVVLQSPEDKNLLQFVMFVDVGRKGSKKMVIPRKIKLSFSDGTDMEIMAESLNSPRMQAGIYMQQSIIRLDMEKYVKLQKYSINKLIIIDHRQNNQLVCYPYKDLLREQANCIASNL